MGESESKFREVKSLFSHYHLVCEACLMNNEINSYLIDLSEK